MLLLNTRLNATAKYQAKYYQEMRWAVHVTRMGERRGVYRVLVEKLEGKGPLWRSRRRLEDDIKMDLQEVGRGGMDWIDLA
jgi:hypothetical protein